MKQKIYIILWGIILSLVLPSSIVLAQNIHSADSTIHAKDTLDNIILISHKSVVVNTPEKIIYNTANDVTTQGGVALDVLKKVPQVDVDIDGNIELQGNANIRFLINGKPSSAFGNSLTDALASIPASDIQKIEVMTTPTAQYDGQGSGGVINIVLKNSPMKGWNNTINLSSGTRLQNGSLGLNYRHANLAMHGFFNGNMQLNSKTPYIQNRTSTDSLGNKTNLLQNGYNNFVRNGYQTGVDASWDISKNDNLSAGFTMENFYSRNKGITNISQEIVNTTSKSQYDRNSLSENKSRIYEWNIGYNKKLSEEGATFSVLYNASYGSPKSYSELSQYEIDSPLNKRGTKVSNPGTDYRNYIAIDYAQPITNRLQLQTGVKGSFQSVTSNSAIQFYQPNSQSYLSDTSQSYKMRYDMNVYAAYVSMNYDWDHILNLVAGGRYEYTTRMMNYQNMRLKNYGNFIPSIILSHDLKQGSYLRLAYTRRLQRPQYKNINPYLDVSDPYNMTTGNPMLQPEIGNNFELGYSNDLGGKGNLYVAAMERINSHDIKPYTSFYDSYDFGDSTYQNVSITNRMNIGKEYNTGAIITSSLNFGKLHWRENALLFVRHIINNFSGGQVTNAFNWRLNMNVSYEWNKNFVTEAFGNYRSGFKSIQGHQPQQLTYTLAFRKQFWNKNGSIGFTATNPFNKYVNQTTTVSANNYTSYYLRQVPYRSFGINFTYKFGKMQQKKKKEEDNYINNSPEMDN